MGLNIDQRRIKVGAANFIASATKQPNDAWLFTFDFSDWLEGEDTILSATVTSAPSGVGHITCSVSSLLPTMVKVLISGGTDNTHYLVTLLGTTKASQTKEVELKLLVLNYPSVVS